MNGRIRRVFLPVGYAFVQGEDGQDYFFQANQLTEGQSWDGMLIQVGRRVEFTPAPADRGKKSPRATEVTVR